MVKITVGLVRHAAKMALKNEVSYLFIHGAKVGINFGFRSCIFGFLYGPDKSSQIQS
jgi:hypothetical protein